eukprot:6203504-Pleurochrysis_carterae.AAC.1
MELVTTRTPPTGLATATGPVRQSTVLLLVGLATATSPMRLATKTLAADGDGGGDAADSDGGSAAAAGSVGDVAGMTTNDGASDRFSG